MKMYVYILACLFFVLPSWSQDVAPTNQLTAMSSTIASNLQALKLESEIMVEQLNQLSQTLKQSETERETLEEQSMKLSSSLTAINEQLNDSYKTITIYEQKLKTQKRFLTVLIVILVIRTIGMIAGYILYAKGIKLPRWLDILL